MCEQCLLCLERRHRGVQITRTLMSRLETAHHELTSHELVTFIFLHAVLATSSRSDYVRPLSLPLATNTTRSSASTRRSPIPSQPRTPKLLSASLLARFSSRTSRFSLSRFLVFLIIFRLSLFVLSAFDGFSCARSIFSGGSASAFLFLSLTPVPALPVLCFMRCSPRRDDRGLGAQGQPAPH